MVSIYYTVGPASKHLTREMFQAGAHGVRQTFSYGTPDIQLELATHLRTEAAKDGYAPDIIADLEGGGYRIGEFIVEGTDRPAITLEKDERIPCVCASTHDVRLGKGIPIPDARFMEGLHIGDVLVIGDGSAELLVEEVAPCVIVRNLFAATIEGRRGLWLQSAHTEHTPVCLTAKDLGDCAHIVSRDEYNAIALSFVSDVVDIERVRTMVRASGKPKRIIAKIETVAALHHLEDICAAADEIMVARGDLELAVTWKKLPAAVDQVVATAVRHAKPCIMATQVAEGMMHGHNLTRAELCDLWNWKQRGIAGVLLSRETCWGDQPVLTVERVHGLVNQ